ncbi:hypothetical protein J6590_031628 [Homalodisca vitripennis]|nr:hypothetical protein J6590_031628 [Homalodisca vitripennis]
MSLDERERITLLMMVGEITDDHTRKHAIYLMTTFTRGSQFLEQLTGDEMSPVTLGPEGSKVARLLLVVSLATIGSVGNVYMISAVIVEDHLKKTGTEDSLLF